MASYAAVVRQWPCFPAMILIQVGMRQRWIRKTTAIDNQANPFLIVCGQITPCTSLAVFSVSTPYVRKRVHFINPTELVLHEASVSLGFYPQNVVFV